MQDQKRPERPEDHAPRTTTVVIDRERYKLTTPTQTGAALKALASIALTDVLFLRRPGADVVIGNDDVVVLKDGDHLYAQPPADYGSGHDDDDGARAGRTTEIFINRAPFEIALRRQTGHALKTLGGVALTDVLFLRRPGADKVITNNEVIVCEEGDRFYSQPPADYGNDVDSRDDGARDRTITIFLNRVSFEIVLRRQTGQSLKTLRGIALTDTLFLRRPGADKVITNEDIVTCNDGEHFYSQPPADYGAAAANILDDLDGFELERQPDGWTFAINRAYELPDAYAPRVVQLLIKLPPTFPDAAPDMFYVTPVVRTLSGEVPVGATVTTILGGEWQQFSWHLAPGAWKPGISDFREYMRCVRSRFERRN